MGLLDWITGGGAAMGSNDQTSDLLNPRMWLQDAFGGRPAATGERVTPESALSIDGYFACLRNRAEDISACTRQVIRREGRRRVQDYSAPAPLIRRRANPHLPTQAFVQDLAFKHDGWGNGYAEIQRSAAGEAIALWPIHPSFVTVHRDADGVFYSVKGYDGNPSVVIPYEDMFHVHPVGPNPYEGYSVATLAREDVALARARKQFSGSFYRNRTQVGGILEYARMLDQEKLNQLRESWMETYGSANQESWKPVILESGMKFTPTAIPPKDAQWIEGEQFGVIVFCRWTRMPPHMVASLDHATFSNIEHQGIEYVQNALTPMALRFEHEWDTKVLGDVDGTGDRYTKINFASRLRGDYSSRVAGYRTMISTAGMTPNEARELEDMDPSDDPAADELWMQGAMAPISRLLEGPAAPAIAAPGGGRDQGRESRDRAEASAARVQELDVVRQLAEVVVAETLVRANRREAIAFGRASKRHDRDPLAFGKWLHKFVAGQQDWLLRALAPHVVAFVQGCLALGLSGAPHDQVLGAFAREYAERLRKDLAAAASAGLAWDEPYAHAESRARGLIGDLVERMQ